MAFVKLDCGLLNSTLWLQREQRELFITALLMAEPYELRNHAEQIAVRNLEYTGFVVPPGWYGFVPAAGIGIIGRAKVEKEVGLSALEALGAPDPESRSPEHDGRRMIRVDGGYLILNFQKYREKDHTSAERSRRYRERKISSRRDNDASRVASRSVTQAEAEAEALPVVNKVQELDSVGLKPDASQKKKFSKPKIGDVQMYCYERKNTVDPSTFIDFYDSNGWKVGKNPMKDWKAAVRTWEQRGKTNSGGNYNAKPSKLQQAAAAIRASHLHRAADVQDVGEEPRLRAISGRLASGNPSDD